MAMRSRCLGRRVSSNSLNDGGVPRGQINKVFPANVSMASVAMMYDAVTDYTDALLNRVFGKVEDYTHQAMRVLVPPTTPANAAVLEQYQVRFTEGFP